MGDLLAGCSEPLDMLALSRAGVLERESHLVVPSGIRTCVPTYI
jgi:hypothetical protein